MCTLTVTQSLTLGEIVTAVRRIQRTTTMGVCRNSPRKSGPFHEIGSNGTNRPAKPLTQFNSRAPILAAIDGGNSDLKPPRLPIVKVDHIQG